MFEGHFGIVQARTFGQGPCEGQPDSRSLPGYHLECQHRAVTFEQDSPTYWCAARKWDEDRGWSVYYWVRVPFDLWQAGLASQTDYGESIARELGDVAYRLRPLGGLVEVVGDLARSTGNVAEGIAGWFRDALDLVCGRFDEGGLNFLKRGKTR